MANEVEANGQGGAVQVTMHAHVDVLPEYKLGEYCQIYEKRMDQYLTSNYIEEDRKVSILLTVMGSDAYKIIRDLTNPTLPKYKTYMQLCAILKDQFSPRVSTF